MKSTELERFDGKIPRHQKETIREASALMGESMAGFVFSAAYERAQEILEREKVWKLSASQSRAFVEACLKAAKPNAALKKAKEAHRKLIQSDA